MPQYVAFVDAGFLRTEGVPLPQFEQHFQFRPQREQKGIDTLIVLDLVRLAQRHAYDTALLIAGDLHTMLTVRP